MGAWYLPHAPKTATSDIACGEPRGGRTWLASGQAGQGRLLLGSSCHLLSRLPFGRLGGEVLGRHRLRSLPSPSRDGPLRPRRCPAASPAPPRRCASSFRALMSSESSPAVLVFGSAPSCGVADNATLSSSRRAESSSMYRSCGKVAPSRASKSRSFVSERGKLAADLLAPRLIARKEPLQGVQARPRALRLAGELGLPLAPPFEEHLRRAEAVLDDAEGKPPHPSEHEPAGLPDLGRQGVEAPAEDGEELLPRAGNPVDGHRVVARGPVAVSESAVKLGEPAFEAGKSSRAAPARSAGRGTARRRGASSRIASRCSSASASASVRTAGLPEAMAFTSA